MKSDARLVLWLTLNRFALDNLQAISRLMEKYKSPEKIFNLDYNDFKNIEGINKQTYRKLKKYYPIYLKESEKEMELLSQSETGIVTFEDDLYPYLLRNIYNPPPLLYYRGDISLLAKEKIVAIVGSRFASVYGRNVAHVLSRELARHNVLIASGMARGIDSYAHAGALETGTTCAVLGSGLDEIYPSENRRLYNSIIEKGVVISEFPLKAKPKRFYFPRRNRIISGVSAGVAVVEAAKRSGSLITANFALEQGREVFAVPGELGTSSSEGTNNLIKNGAKLISNYSDILEALEFDEIQRPETIEKKSEVPSLSSEEQLILDYLNSDLKSVGDIFNSLDFPISKIQSVLLGLELKNLVKQEIGKRYRRC